MEEELDTSPSRGVAGVTVTRDRHGLIVTQAPKSLRLRPGDRLLSARVFFEGTPPEEVTRVLEGTGGCRVSLRVRRPVTRDTGDKGQRGTVTRLLPKLLSSRIVPDAPPSAPKSSPRRITVKEAAAGKTAATPSPPPTPEPPRDTPKSPPAPGGAAKRPQTNPKAAAPKAPDAIRVPSIAIAVPSAAVELVPDLGAAKAEAPAERRPSVPAPPAIAVAAPRGGLALAPPAVPPVAPLGFAEGLRKLSLELDAVPALEIAPPVPAPLGGDGKTKPGKFTLPRVGLAIAKFKPGGAASPLEPVLAPGGGVKVKIPKLSLVPFGDGDTALKPQRSGGSLPKLVAAPESVKLPKFGGSSPDIRGVGVAKTLRRGGSAESLVLAVGRKMMEAPVPQFTGLAAKRRERPLDGKTPKPLKVPALELAPPGMDEKEAGERFGVKLPKFGGVSVKEKRGGEQGDPGRCVNGEAQAKIWRWVPKVGFAPPEPTKARPKGGSPPKPRFPDVEICAEAPVSPKLHFGGPGTPKFQLPKVVLSPQPCEW